MPEDKKEYFVVRIGPLLNDILEKQVESIKNATYDVCESSFWEAGEIVAKKINSNSF